MGETFSPMVRRWMQTSTKNIQIAQKNIRKKGQAHQTCIPGIQKGMQKTESSNAIYLTRANEKEPAKLLESAEIRQTEVRQTTH